MTSIRASGTEGYAEHADSLVRHFESATFAGVHRQILHLLPAAPAKMLDIGAGTGRDAAALAGMGHEVVAVEPTDELRMAARSLHPSPRIEWIDDSLPDLARLADRGGVFDAILLTAVWMHLDGAQRRRAMPNVARLLGPDGTVFFSLRHGSVPPGRRMFDVTADETVALAALEGLHPVLRMENQDGYFKRPDVHWTRLAFSRVRSSA